MTTEATLAPSVPPSPETSATEVLGRYRTVRAVTEGIAAPLAPEDCVVQTMEDVSPTKWHLAHVSWFFETFVVEPHLAGYRPLNPQYAYLFNSYYVQAGERHCRDRRGYISRPTVDEVYEYRAYIDRHVAELLETAPEETLETVAPLIEIGLNHEQQHQELMLTDIKHVFSVNPLRPAYRDRPPETAPAGPLAWVPFDGGLHEIGHDGTSFTYDNETPRHRHYLEPYRLADRLVTNGEYLAFMDDGGYERADLWLSEGYATARESGWSEPFYWEKRDGRWWIFTLAGMREVDESEPVCHVSYFEADAYARWAGARLPTEQEWEVAALELPVRGNTFDTGRLHPAPAGRASDAVASGVSTVGSPAGERPPPPRQMYGDLWEWTRSQYSPYPGFQPLPGALGEYNGKFMCNQFVLRGGSCATSASHIRPTYRNFFVPDATWQFMGIRLARDA
jgi:ergothioneine biosynthesis protein EgtB